MVVAENGVGRVNTLEQLEGMNVPDIARWYSSYFVKTIEIRDPDPEAPFLFWRPYKERQEMLLGRAQMVVARRLFGDHNVTAELCLPSSATWLYRCTAWEDFEAQALYVSRSGANGAKETKVPSYTKLADGELRDNGEPRENLPMFVEEGTFEGGDVIVYDDVFAGGLSAKYFAYGLRSHFGGRIGNVFSVAGFSKNMEGGIAMLNHPESPVDRAVALVQVVAVSAEGPHQLDDPLAKWYQVRGGHLAIKRWWEAEGWK